MQEKNNWTYKLFQIIFLGKNITSNGLLSAQVEAKLISLLCQAQWNSLLLYFFTPPIPSTKSECLFPLLCVYWDKEFDTKGEKKSFIVNLVHSTTINPSTPITLSTFHSFSMNMVYLLINSSEKITI